MTAIVQMRTFDQKGQQTVPVEVTITGTDPTCTTAKAIVVAAAKKFKSVTKQSRVYHGMTRLEMAGDVLLEDLKGNHVVLAGKVGWKGALAGAVAGAGYPSEKICGNVDAQVIEVPAVPSSASTSAGDAQAAEPDAESRQHELAEAAKSERSDGVVLVWKDTQDNGYLSNWAKSPIVLDGTKYNCVEQWIMASKARACGDGSVEYQVMRTANPRKQKALGRSIDKKAVDRHWGVQQKWNIQLRGCTAKFQQNETLARRLLQTGQKPIAEASPSDTIFGIGLAPNNPLAQDPANWRGLNLLGKALMQVREELRQHISAGKDLATFQLNSEVMESSTTHDLVDVSIPLETESSAEDSDIPG